MSEDNAPRVRQGPADGSHLNPLPGQFGRRGALADHRDGAPFERLGNVSVTVGLPALNGKEKRSGTHVTGVVSQRRHFRRGVCARAQNGQFPEQLA